MTILKKMLNEEHEAIKFSYNSYDAERSEMGARVDIRSNQIVIRCTKLPQEVTLTFDDEQSNLGFRGKWKIRESVNEMQKAAFEKDAKATKELMDSFSGKFFTSRVVGETMIDTLEKELSGLFDHLNTLLRAKLLEFYHDVEEEEAKYWEKHKSEMVAKLQAIINK